MSLRGRIISAKTPEAARKAAKLAAEGKDPVTGKKAGVKGCPDCEIKQPQKETAKPSEGRKAE
jgi:hypothetical protein